MEVSHYKMAANNITNLHEKFSHEVEVKRNKLDNENDRRLDQLVGGL